jgi:hypothetical protein
MKNIDYDGLTLSTLCHIVSSLKDIRQRLDAIESKSDACIEILESIDEYVEADYEEIEQTDSEAIADQMLDAADEIAAGRLAPRSQEVAEKLREIANMIREESW